MPNPNLLSAIDNHHFGSLMNRCQQRRFFVQFGHLWNLDLANYVLRSHQKHNEIQGLSSFGKAYVRLALFQFYGRVAFTNHAKQPVG